MLGSFSRDQGRLATTHVLSLKEPTLSCNQVSILRPGKARIEGTKSCGQSPSRDLTGELGLHAISQSPVRTTDFVFLLASFDDLLCLGK
jgi:hypothetical protein